MRIPPVECERCNRPMDGSSCDPQLNAYTWGTEPGELVPWPCSDCGVTTGGHHHLSCLAAFCRVCDDQWVMCEGIDCNPRDLPHLLTLTLSATN